MTSVIDSRQIRSGLGGRLLFLRGFLRCPALVGSVIPSSRYLAQRLAHTAAISRARLVVEFGPGTGSTTRALLDELPEGARLLAIEINPQFVSHLRANPDPRLIVHQGSAEHIGETLAHYNLQRPDTVISGIPFSTMPAGLGQRILGAMWASLAPGGRFVAYQFREKVAVLGRDLLGTPKVEMELLNIPPMRVYHWSKPVDGEAPAQRLARGP